MPVDLNNTTPVDPDEAQFRTMFENLQGNILAGHGRDHTVHIFFEFGPDLDALRVGLSSLASRVVTSAWQQHVESADFQGFGIPGGLFGNLFLTANAYRKLGFSDQQISQALPEHTGSFGEKSSFAAGMRAHGDELNDPPPAEWESGYRDGAIDAMLLIADDDEAFLLRQARAAATELRHFAKVLVVERGNALRNDAGEGIEHFGYVDGRSQPLFLKSEFDKEGKTDKWNPFEPLKRVLVEDKGVADADSFGSFFVFRKLEQDVLRFKIREQELADALDLRGDDRERAGAMVVGRFEDGTPLALSQTDGFLPVKENNFTYDVDPDGVRCPFAAHIRKTNPRGDISRQFGVPEEAERQRRVARRGITYGERTRHPDAFQALEDLPTGGVGLLFMCFQASISNQFAFIQRSWANNEGFLTGGVGLDPVIGQAPASGQAPITQNWLKQWGDAATLPFSFEGFVTLKGGEFFFAPSIPFLRVLAHP
jgi:Dyp-type peroxidase family